MIKTVQVPRYKAVCDGCGEEHRFEAETEHGAISVVTSVHDWKTISSKLFCNTCVIAKRWLTGKG
jgi:hypothetical protein